MHRRLSEETYQCVSGADNLRDSRNETPKLITWSLIEVRLFGLLFRFVPPYGVPQIPVRRLVTCSEDECKATDLELVSR